MKKYILLSILMLILPIAVFAEETCDNVTYDTYCKGNTCLNNLQEEYNTWNTTNNTGKQCIKVIAQIKNTTKSYLSGKNPNTDYKCSDGSTAIAELKGTPISNPEEVTDCSEEICYVPEIWQMDCGNESSNPGSNLNDDSNQDDDYGSNDDDNNNDNANTNDDGQITGPTDPSDTGVETYFIVLLIMVMLSTLILQISKKKNLFKNI